MENIPIKGLENYMINENGEVFSRLSGKFLKPLVVGEYYKYIHYGLKNTLAGKTVFYKAHRLAAITFLGASPKDKPRVIHIDGNTLNNCSSNLQWGFHSEAKESKLPDSVKNRMESASARTRDIKLTKGSRSTVVGSVKEAAQILKTYRRKVYRYNGKILNGYQIEFI